MDKKIAGLALTGVLLISGCSAGFQAAEPAASSSVRAPAASPRAEDTAPVAGTAHDAAAFRAWGLKPLAAPPAPPKVKPVKRRAGEPVPVISDIPTKDKIVFITFDDGAEKDPRFVKMMRELKVPFTMFLTDSLISADYDYFKPLQQLGNTIQNHTLTHPNLRTKSAAAQREEICGQQTRLGKEYGTVPRLLRPPYGNWNESTRSAAGQCGVEAIVLWRESMQITNMQYQRPDKKLHPGDIILAHFRGPGELKGHSMTEMTANMLRHIQEQGFTVARLEDYI
ncbi:polysaccharide deacetylase family protein [Streptomyces sp. NPDC056231]|uniref:polysaccharide deacetylase family protein n=1 Tax=Streptomyces sp. NPDC056231 TaxID=3345755 RepID=UPI003AAD4EFD